MDISLIDSIKVCPACDQFVEKQIPETGTEAFAKCVNAIKEKVQSMLEISRELNEQAEQRLLKDHSKSNIRDIHILQYTSMSLVIYTRHMQQLAVSPQA